jgi:hypothetical protein
MCGFRLYARVCELCIYAGAGTCLALLFRVNALLSLNTLIVTMALLAFWTLLTIDVTELSLLSRFLILIYALPFSTLLGYVFIPDYIWTWTPEGIRAASDRLLMKQLVSIGLIGLLGLVAGMRTAGLIRPVLPHLHIPSFDERQQRARLGLPAFMLLLVLALGFSYLSAPSATILQTQYGGAQLRTTALALNFPASYVVSYVLLVALFIDGEREARGRLRRTKFAALMAVIFYIVIFLQLLRGDRESSGLVVALLGMYLTSPLRPTQRESWRKLLRTRLRVVSVICLAAAPLFVAIGSLRFTLTDAAARTILASMGFSQSARSIWNHSPWTMTLLSNLGVTSLYRGGRLVLRHGETYLDYLLSLPPGLITHAIGIERAVEANRNLAADIIGTGVTSGGLHVVNVGFMNFGALGAFAVMMLYGFLVGRLEQGAARGEFWLRLLWGSVFVVSFMWFWYGEMSMVRGVMAGILVGCMYQLMLAASLLPARLRRVESRLPADPHNALSV